VSALYDRFLPSVKSRESDRTPVAKDRDRIVHSSALRRLQGKSQVVGADVGPYFRNRLTHSLECAQIGRAIALLVQTGWEDVVEARDELPDLVEAACLGHDLGHPPFGHNGERALQGCMRKRAGSLFEGNAQSFRIVTYLEPKEIGAVRADRDRWVGLNLTRATLKALAKYPRIEGSDDLSAAHPKFSVYDDLLDRETWEWLWEGVHPARTLATDIMDVADDIAYATHDLEDGVWAGLIPTYQLVRRDEAALGLLLDKLQERRPEATLDEVKTGLVDLFQDAADEAQLDRTQLRWLWRPFERTRQDVSYLKRFTAALIGLFIQAVLDNGRFTKPDPQTRFRLDLLTAIAWVWVIERSELATTQFGQRRLVRELFEGYWADDRTLPRREEMSEITGGEDAEGRRPEKARVICDHIAGMTDQYALRAHEEMYGARPRFEVRLGY
jgi:dGTPase